MDLGALSVSGLRRLAHQLDLDVGERVAVHLAVLGVPDEGLVIHELPDIAADAAAAVGRDAGRFHHPLVALARPEAFGETAARVEDPRTDLARGWVPANSLRHGERFGVAQLDGEL